MEKYRIKRIKIISGGFYSSPSMEMDSMKDFIDYLEKEKAGKINLIYMGVYDNTIRFYKTGLKVTEIKQEHLDWLTIKQNSETKYFEIV